MEIADSRKLLRTLNYELSTDRHHFPDGWQCAEPGLLPVLEDQHPAVDLAHSQLVWTGFCGKGKRRKENINATRKMPGLGQRKSITRDKIDRGLKMLNITCLNP